MDMKELQQKSDRDLKEFVNEKRETLRDLRFKGSGSGMRDTHAIRKVRHDVARGLTELNRRNREEAKSNA